jgi:hypothetical protein
MVLLPMELVLSWWASYSSLAGTIASAAMGLALSLLMFVGRIPEQSTELDNHDLIFKETPPPPPTQWRDDDDSADSSFGSARQAFQTPLMRKSILPDDEDEDEQPGTKSILRKRKSSAPDLATPEIKGRVISINPNKRKQPATTVLWRIIGTLMALLLTLIPSSLIAAGEDPSYEMTRASIMGCKPMRVVYKQDASDAWINNVSTSPEKFQCAGGCVPLSRTKVAARKEGMRDGRCDSIGFRCDAGEGTMVLKSYQLDVGLYEITSSDRSCAVIDEESSLNGETEEEAA